MPTHLKRSGYGLDFGYSNDPTAVVHCGLYQGELYLDEKIYKTGMLNQDIYEASQRVGIRKSDPIYADSADPKSIKELQLMGLRVYSAQKGRDSVNFGIQKIKTYKINVTRGSINLIKEFRNYKYMQDRSGDFTNKPVDAFNHGIDAIRYWGEKNLSSRSLKASGFKSNI